MQANTLEELLLLFRDMSPEQKAELLATAKILLSHQPQPPERS